MCDSPQHRIPALNLEKVDDPIKVLGTKSSSSTQRVNHKPGDDTGVLVTINTSGRVSKTPRNQTVKRTWDTQLQSHRPNHYSLHPHNKYSDFRSARNRFPQGDLQFPMIERSSLSPGSHISEESNLTIKSFSLHNSKCVNQP